jgi:hypothetical protein
LGANAFISQYKSHKQYNFENLPISIALISQKTYALVGFEPGSSVPLANTVTTGLRRRARAVVKKVALEQTKK